MKIAIISVGRSHLINLARLLDKKEDVDVTFYTMMPKFRCRKFGYTGRVVSLFFPIGILSVLLDKLPFPRSPYKRSSIRFVLRRWLDALVGFFLKPCDVLIGLNGVGIKASQKARKRYGTITICDQGSSHILHQNKVHYSYSEVFISDGNTNFMLEHYSIVDYFMVPSIYVRQTDLLNGIDAEKILLNPYGVDINRFRMTENPVGKDDCYDVIMVGSWWKHKGCDMLADACVNTLGLKLLHVGSVVDCALPDSPNFTHIDFVPEFELPKYYAKSKIMVLCSLDEGYGLVLLQAAACGLPLVYSSRTGGADLKKLLNNSDWCFEIAEPLTMETISHAITEAMNKYQGIPKGVRNQFEDCIYNISWDAYADRYLNILKEIVKL